MSEAWPNSREASKSVAFTSSTVAPVERRGEEGRMKRVDRKKKKKKFTTHGEEEKGKQEVSARVIGKICEVK